MLGPSALRHRVQELVRTGARGNPPPLEWAALLAAAGIPLDVAADLPGRLGLGFHVGAWTEQDVVDQLATWEQALRVRAMDAEADAVAAAVTTLRAGDTPPDSASVDSASVDSASVDSAPPQGAPSDRGPSGSGSPSGPSSGGWSPAAWSPAGPSPDTQLPDTLGVGTGRAPGAGPVHPPGAPTPTGTAPAQGWAPPTGPSLPEPSDDGVDAAAAYPVPSPGFPGDVGAPSAPAPPPGPSGRRDGDAADPTALPGPGPGTAPAGSAVGRWLRRGVPVVVVLALGAYVLGGFEWDSWSDLVPEEELSASTLTEENLLTEEAVRARLDTELVRLREDLAVAVQQSGLEVELEEETTELECSRRTADGLLPARTEVRFTGRRPVSDTGPRQRWDTAQVAALFDAIPDRDPDDGYESWAHLRDDEVTRDDVWRWRTDPISSTYADAELHMYDYGFGSLAVALVTPCYVRDEDRTLPPGTEPVPEADHVHPSWRRGGGMTAEELVTWWAQWAPTVLTAVQDAAAAAGVAGGLVEVGPRTNGPFCSSYAAVAGDPAMVGRTSRWESAERVTVKQAEALAAHLAGLREEPDGPGPRAQEDGYWNWRLSQDGTPGGNDGHAHGSWRDEGDGTGVLRLGVESPCARP